MNHRHGGLRHHAPVPATIRTVIRRLCTGLVVALGAVILVLAVPAASQDAAAPQDDAPGTVRGGRVNWLLDTPPGDTAWVRVRGEALSALLSAGDDWHVTVDGEPAPASLCLPEPQPSPEHSALDILWQKETADGTLQVLLDRGGDPPEIDRLMLYFAAATVLSAVQVEYSPDNEVFTPAARWQVVCQRLDSGVMRLATITVSPAGARYLRLNVAGAADVRLDRAEAWSEPPPPWHMYEVEAGLGPMYDAAIPGEHLWPLLLPDDGLPLAKLKVLAESPGTMRRVRAVRTGADGMPRENVSEAVWADRLQAGSMAGRHTRSEKWVYLHGTSGGELGWAVAVDDGENPALQLTGVQVYAAEVELGIALPRDGVGVDPAALTPAPLAPGQSAFTADRAKPVVELWLEAPAEPRTGVSPLPPIERQVTGELTSLTLSREPAAAGLAGAGLGWEAGLEDAWNNWHRAVIIGWLCLAALWLGLFLLQRREPEGLSD